MKITKRQLRRIIKEALDDDFFNQVNPKLPRGDQPIEVVDEVEWEGDYGFGSKDPQRPWGSYAERGGESYQDTIVMSPNGDSVLVDGRETYITDVPKQLEYSSGFEMSDVDADNLIFALETQQQDGYVELGVVYKNGEWGW